MSTAVSPQISVDQVAAFVELARRGSLRQAAESLFISEQGLRSRLLILERNLGVELYRKSRGPRRRTPLTPQGQQFLVHAESFLASAVHLGGLFKSDRELQEVHVIASHYLIAYVLIDMVREFHREYPNIRVRLSARTEHEIEETLREDRDIAFGVAAPYEPSTNLAYRHLFSMSWSLITPRRHPLSTKKNVQLVDLVSFPLVLYERGSSGRQHVAEAFQRAGLEPQIEMEATNTDLLVRMVEAGLGIAVVPLHPSGAVTRGRRVAIQSLGQQLRPIDSGILLRRNEKLTDAAEKLLNVLSAHSARSG